MFKVKRILNQISRKSSKLTENRDRGTGWKSDSVGANELNTLFSETVENHVSNRVRQGSVLKLDGNTMVSSLPQFNSSASGERVVLKKRVLTEALPKPVVELIQCDDIGKTVGLQSKLDEVWEVLMNPEVDVLGLYGPAGGGKTTLLTHINNKFFHSPGDFDFVIWIVVSKHFTISKLQDEIAERIGIAVNGWEKKAPNEKTTAIFFFLREKKFVLLMDDLWSDVVMEKVGIPYATRENGSKIVVTSRLEQLCSLMDSETRIMVEKIV